jgi:hypothetical protein
MAFSRIKGFGCHAQVFVKDWPAEPPAAACKKRASPMI